MEFVKNDITWKCDGYSTVRYLKENFGMCLENACEFVPEAILYPCYFVDHCKDGVDRIRVSCFLKQENGFNHFGLLTEADTGKRYVYYANVFTLRPTDTTNQLYERLFI